jgi:LacI family transcriptional regulator
MPTLRDVARQAGTSTATASAVLNGGGRDAIRVSEATRGRIRAAASALGYKPNRVARSLVTGRTGVLGLVFPYAGAFIDRNPFCSQVMAGVLEEVVCEQYNLMLHTAAGKDTESPFADGTLPDARADGLLVVIPRPNDPVLTRCRSENFPCVALVYESGPGEEDLLTVNADEFAGGRLAAEHLLTLGHRRIAHLTGNPEVATAEPRRRGYLAALEEAGIAPDPALIVPANFDWTAGYAAMARLLDLPSDRRPTAVFAANDLCAEGALRAILERGLRVPEDIALVGYDDTWFAARTRPPLTTVRMPIEEMSALAARLLIAAVERREIPDRRPLLPVSLTVRESCGAEAPRRFH